MVMKVRTLINYGKERRVVFLWLSLGVGSSPDRRVVEGRGNHFKRSPLWINRLKIGGE